MRTILAMLVSLFGISCLAAETAPPQRASSRTAKPAMARYSVDLAKPGALDRLDSMIFAAPALYYYYHFILDTSTWG